MRIGLASVRGLGDDLAEPHRGRAGGPRPLRQPRGPGAPGAGAVSVAQLEALATAGALGCFGLDRRRALWVAGAVAQAGADRLDGIVTGVDAPTLPGLDPIDEARADLWATGVSPEGIPPGSCGDCWTSLGVVTAAGLVDGDHGSRVTVGGVVTHRQRPATAGGTTFLNLEDETGLLNIVVSKGCWAHHRRVVRTAPAVLVRGRLERVEGVTNVIAERIEALPIRATSGAGTSADRRARLGTGWCRPRRARPWRACRVPRIPPAASGSRQTPAAPRRAGDGVPVLVLHGAYSALEEPEGYLEPFFRTRRGHRRIYVDLPGMGASPADGIDGPGDALDAIAAVVDDRIGDEPFLVVAQSYGGYLARGLVDRRPAQVAGLALICPLLISGGFAGRHAAVQVAGDIDGMLTPEQDAEYRGYFVVQTPETARRFLEAVAPVLGRFDGPAVERIMEGRLDPDPDACLGVLGSHADRDRAAGRGGGLRRPVGPARAVPARHVRGARHGGPRPAARAARPARRAPGRLARPGGRDGDMTM